MFKFRNLSLVLVFLLILSFAGCGASSTRDFAENNISESESRQQFGTGHSSASEGDLNYNNAETAPSTSPDENIRKVIRNGDITIEVESVEESYEEIMDLVRSLGGEEFDKNYFSGNHTRMTVVVKLPPEVLDEFENELRSVIGTGKIKRIDIRSQDITSQYHDTKARLNSFIGSRDRLLELYDMAENVQETLNIQREITRIQADIDSLQGQINMWDRLVDMSTLTIYINQIPDPTKTPDSIEWRFDSFENILQTLRYTFLIVTSNVYSLVVWTLIVIISSTPVLIPLGIIAWILIRKYKKNSQD